MIPHPNYSDFYKFQTSFGLFLILGSVLILALFLNYNFELMKEFSISYSPETLAKQGYGGSTIDLIQTVYASIINFGLVLMKIIPFVTFVMLLVGILLFSRGLTAWGKKQKSIDSHEKLMMEHEKFKLEITKQHPLLKKNMFEEKLLKKKYPIKIENEP